MVIGATQAIDSNVEIERQYRGQESELPFSGLYLFVWTGHGNESRDMDKVTARKMALLCHLPRFWWFDVWPIWRPQSCLFQWSARCRKNRRESALSSSSMFVCFRCYLCHCFHCPAQQRPQLRSIQCNLPHWCLHSHSRHWHLPLRRHLSMNCYLNCLNWSRWQLTQPSAVHL